MTVAAAVAVRVAVVATMSRHLPPVVAAVARVAAVPPLKLQLSLTATPMAAAVAATTSPRKKRVAAAVATTSPSRLWRKLPLVVAAVELAVAAPSSPLKVTTLIDIF